MQLAGVDVGSGIGGGVGDPPPSPPAHGGLLQNAQSTVTDARGPNRHQPGRDCRASGMGPANRAKISHKSSPSQEYPDREHDHVAERPEDVDFILFFDEIGQSIGPRARISIQYVQYMRTKYRHPTPHTYGGVQSREIHKKLYNHVEVVATYTKNTRVGSTDFGSVDASLPTMVKPSAATTAMLASTWKRVSGRVYTVHRMGSTDQPA